jgi:hypothetical protein
VVQAIRRAGLEPTEERREGDWVALLVRRARDEGPVTEG